MQMNTQNYQLDTPVNRPIYVPDENESGFAPVINPPLPSQQDQTHRQMTWLFHKPQNHAIFPVATQPVKIGKKK
jgi:hypothetical protein